MTIAILANTALVLILLLIDSIWFRSKTLDFKERMLACELEVERAKNAVLKEHIAWIMS